MEHTHIFNRLLNGEPVSFNDKDYHQVRAGSNATRKLLVKLNTESDENHIRTILSEIINQKIDESTTLFPPFHTNYGQHTKIGKNVFINFDCTFLDWGGITIEDNVLIAPKVSLLTEGHPVDINNRKVLTTGRIHIKENVWIGANATILQGVTIGRNSIVAAGAVVSNDVPDNVIVGGAPAKIIKHIE